MSIPWTVNGSSEWAYIWQKWEQFHQRGMGREEVGRKRKERDVKRRGGEEKGRRGMGREELGRKGKERDWERRGGGGKGKERDGERRGGKKREGKGLGEKGRRKDSVPVQNKQKTKQNKSNNPQAHGMSAWSRKKAGCKIRWIDWEL